ncbi:hypothetical protein CCZ01_08325 [Helicobacter monodelphidis]|uniref:hypothetical protein n=1 Tax=Helicobacter sp. 15-1451 TaxID=2004995 RepID=UPI000DCB9049|nr:hypothetical protein [Helicobacter sp. 15-1451]RAX56780.1 hypothetical protein CCZ01_08325 [Helicobacter sp. 15-1451]
MKICLSVVVVLSFFSFLWADNYVEFKNQTSSTANTKKSRYDSMRSVPTINADGRKPALQPLHTLREENAKKQIIDEQIRKMRSKNPNSEKGYVIDGRTGKVVGMLSSSRTKELPKSRSKIQTHTGKSNIQPVSPKVQIGSYEMQEERIDL